MKIKEEKGISAIMLIIVIFILIIICVVGICYFKKVVSKENLQTLETNMLLIQAKVKIIQEQTNIEEKTLIGTLISNEKLEELKLNKIIEKYSESDKFYKLNKDDLNSLGLGSINTKDDEYIVNYTDGEIVYEKGYKDEDGDVYYRLSQIKELTQTLSTNESI